MNENKMKKVAEKLMKKLKDIDFEKVSAITIGIQMSGEDHHKEKDHHIMADGTKMPGKTHKEYEKMMEEKEDYDD